MQEAMQGRRDRTEECNGNQREQTPDHVSSKHIQQHAVFQQARASATSRTFQVSTARQMQIETGTGCHFSPTRLAMKKMIDILLSWQRYGEQELVHCWWVQKKFLVEYAFQREHNLGLSIKIKNVYALTQQFYFREFAAFLAPRKVLGAKNKPSINIH